MIAIGESVSQPVTDRLQGGFVVGVSIKAVIGIGHGYIARLNLLPFLRLLIAHVQHGFQK